MFRTWVWQKQELYARDPQQQLDSLHLWVGGYGISVLSPIKQQQLPGGSTTNHMPSLSTSFFIFLPGKINYKPLDAQSQHISSEDQLQTTCPAPLSTSFYLHSVTMGISKVWVNGYTNVSLSCLNECESVIKSSDLFETLQSFPPFVKIVAGAANKPACFAKSGSEWLSVWDHKVRGASLLVQWLSIYSKVLQYWDY